MCLDLDAKYRESIGYVGEREKAYKQKAKYYLQCMLESCGKNFSPKFPKVIGCICWTENDNVTWSQYNLALKLLWWGDCLNSIWIPDKKSRFIGHWTGKRISMGTLSKLTWEKKYMCSWPLGISSVAHFKNPFTHNLKGKSILISLCHQKICRKGIYSWDLRNRIITFPPKLWRKQKLIGEIFNYINCSWRK